MKILIIQPWIKAGGSEGVSACLAFHLGQKGHQVELAALFTDFRGVSPKARQVKYITPGRKIARLCQKNQLFFLLFGPLVLFCLVFKNSDKKTVLQPHNLPSYWVAVLVGWFKKIPVVWLCSEPPAKVKIKEQGFLKALAWAVAASTLDKSFVKMIDKIIVFSSKSQKWVKKRYGKEAVIVNAPPDFEFFSRGKIKRKGNKFVLLTVGKLYEIKNQIVCLEALKLVESKIPEAILFVVGRGANEQILKAKSKALGLQKKVKFLGFVSSKGLRDLYWSADINLFPAFKQSWGLTPLEALSAKTISIVSDEAGVGELLEKEKIGLVCPARPQAFAKHIWQVYQNKNRFEKMAEKGYLWLKKNMNWQKFTEEVLEVIKNQ